MTFVVRICGSPAALGLGEMISIPRGTVETVGPRPSCSSVNFCPVPLIEGLCWCSTGLLIDADANMDSKRARPVNGCCGAGGVGSGNGGAEGVSFENSISNSDIDD